MPKTCSGDRRGCDGSRDGCHFFLPVTVNDYGVGKKMILTCLLHTLVAKGTSLFHKQKLSCQD